MARELGLIVDADERSDLGCAHAAAEELLRAGGSGHNELLIGKAIAGRRDKVQLSVKFGAMRGPDGSPTGIGEGP